MLDPRVVKPTQPRPNWMVQCRLLILFATAFDGGTAEAGTALEELGFFTSVRVSQ